IVASGGARGVTATTLLALAQVAQPAIVLLGRTNLDTPEPTACRGIVDEPGLKKALVAQKKALGLPVALPEIAREASQILAAREIRAFLRTLEATGARAVYKSVDVRDADAVAAVVDDAARTLGPITGVVHGAGVLKDKKLEDKDRSQLDAVLDTKVLGLQALLHATAAYELKFLSVFSSVAGRFGNVGQVDYAMANEALTKMA